MTEVFFLILSQKLDKKNITFILSLFHQLNESLFQYFENGISKNFLTWTLYNKLKIYTQNFIRYLNKTAIYYQAIFKTLTFDYWLHFVDESITFLN